MFILDMKSIGDVVELVELVLPEVFRCLVNIEKARSRCNMRLTASGSLRKAVAGDRELALVWQDAGIKYSFSSNSTTSPTFSLYFQCLRQTIRFPFRSDSGNRLR